MLGLNLLTGKKKKKKRRLKTAEEGGKGRAGTVCQPAASPPVFPQQDGLFMGGLHGSLTEKTLIQHILSMFTYRDRGVGGNLRVCFCVLERELI